MKQNLNALLSFEIFFGIFRLINARLSENSYHLTDVHFHTGNGCEPSIPYGYFRTRTSLRQIESLKEEAVVIEPFGMATDTSKSAVTEYLVIVLNVRSSSGKYGIVFQPKGHMGAPTNQRTQIDLSIKEMTNVILLLPMNVSMSSTGNKVMQTQYHFENLVYAKDGNVYFPYTVWEKVIDDIRD
jgi:hypothetical protein